MARQVCMLRSLLNLDIVCLCSHGKPANCSAFLAFSPKFLESKCSDWLADTGVFAKASQAATPAPSTAGPKERPAPMTRSVQATQLSRQRQADAFLPHLSRSTMAQSSSFMPASNLLARRQATRQMPERDAGGYAETPLLQAQQRPSCLKQPPILGTRPDPQSSNPQNLSRSNQSTPDFGPVGFADRPFPRKGMHEVADCCKECPAGRPETETFPWPAHFAPSEKKGIAPSVGPGSLPSDAEWSQDTNFAPSGRDNALGRNLLPAAGRGRGRRGMGSKFPKRPLKKAFGTEEDENLADDRGQSSAMGSGRAKGSRGRGRPRKRQVQAADDEDCWGGVRH